MNVHSIFITQKPQPTFKYPSICKYINKMWSICILEYSSVIKIIEVLIYATTQMNLKNIMLSGRIQKQKIIYYIIPYI